MECERGATARLEEPRRGPKGLAPRGFRHTLKREAANAAGYMGRIATGVRR
jgi:hypothetical protein